MRNFFFFLISTDLKNEIFFTFFCRYCWVEHMWKVPGKNKLYLKFIWAHKKFNLFKQKTMFLANNKPLSKIYAKFSIAERKKKKKNKNDQVMGNSELKLKIYFKVFSYHNMPEVERFRQMMYRSFCKSIGFHTNWIK